MSQKSEITVRFHTEADRNDSEAFAIPVNLIYQHRQVYLSRVPDFSEKQIDKIFPFPAKDGSWGCVFKLTAQGRIRLETMSGEIRGSVLVVFIGTKAGKRQVADMIIDRPVSDGIISIPRGLTQQEILQLKKQFKTIGEKEKKWGEKPRSPVEKLPGGNAEPQSSKPSLLEPLSTARPSRRGGSPEPDLPRLQD
ncbi:MAG: hypothetical protein ABI318_10085 [Chthoniobacteraceae bacterium]